MPDFHVGDYGGMIEVALTQAGKPFDPTGAAVTVVFYASGTVKPAVSMEVMAPLAAGKVRYAIPKGLLDVEGDWRAKLTVTKPDAILQAWFEFSVGA
jgi:hypothetical protein